MAATEQPDASGGARDEPLLRRLVVPRCVDRRMTDTDLGRYRTLSQFEARAQAIVPPDALAYATGGSASEATLERNRRALQHLAIEQRVLVGVQTIDSTTRFL